jgi:hypothetical protein
MPIKRLSQSGLLTFEKYSSMLAGNPGYIPPAFELLQSEILTTDTTVVFSNINSTYGSTYKHLQLRMSVRSDRANTGDILTLTVNNDSTAGNYAYHGLSGGTLFGNTTSSWAENQNRYAVTYVQASSDPANAFSGIVMDILDPFITTKFTSFRSFFDGAYDRQVVLQSMLWKNTAAIDSISLAPGIGTNWKQGSRFSLYGLRA